MGAYIKPKHLAGLSEPHKDEIRHNFGLDKDGRRLSTQQRVLEIILHGKIGLLGKKGVPSTLTLEQIHSLFPQIPKENIEQQFSKVQFLTYRTYTLVSNIYGGKKEDIIRGLGIKGVSPNLHILYQILKRCNSLEECISILEMDELAHLKGTYNEYITTIVFSKCKNFPQKKRAKRYLTGGCIEFASKRNVRSKAPATIENLGASPNPINTPKQTIASVYHNEPLSNQYGRNSESRTPPTSLEQEALAAGISVSLLRIARTNANTPWGRMGNVGRKNKKGSKFGTKHK